MNKNKLHCRGSSLETSHSSLPQKTATLKNSVFFQTVLVLLLSFAHIWWLTLELTENCTSESQKLVKKRICNPWFWPSCYKCCIYRNYNWSFIIIPISWYIPKKQDPNKLSERIFVAYDSVTIWWNKFTSENDILKPSLIQLPLTLQLKL